MSGIIPVAPPAIPPPEPSPTRGEGVTAGPIKFSDSGNWDGSRLRRRPNISATIFSFVMHVCGFDSGLDSRIRGRRQGVAWIPSENEHHGCALISNACAEAGCGCALD